MKSKRLLCVALLGALLGAASCTPKPEAVDPAALIGQADAILSAGDAAGALALLEPLDPAQYPAVLLLRAQSNIQLGRFDDALDALATAPDDTTTNALRGDACVLGVMATIPDSATALAEQRIAPCAAHQRIDVEAARVAVEALAMREVREATLGDLNERLRTFTGSPEVDRAAELLEQTALWLAERAPTPFSKIRFLSRAFEVGQAPELRDEILQMAIREGELLVESDPHQAVSILEHLYISRVSGLEVPANVKERAEASARRALRPIFTESFRGRYAQKEFDVADRAAGILSEAGSTLTFAGATDEARADAARTWLYRSYERPRPVQSPDYLASWGQCPPAPAVCAVPFEEGARWAHDVDLLEEELAAQLGRPLDWGSPSAE